MLTHTLQKWISACHKVLCSTKSEQCLARLHSLTFKHHLESSHCVSWRARREIRPSMHMPRKLSLGCAAQMAIQSASHAFQCAPPCFTCCVGSKTANHPAACRESQACRISGEQKPCPLLRYNELHVQALEPSGTDNARTLRNRCSSHQEMDAPYGGDMQILVSSARNLQAALL